MLKASAEKNETFRMRLKYQIESVNRDYFMLHLTDGKFDLAEQCLDNYKHALMEFKPYSLSPDADWAGYYNYYADLQSAKENYAEAQDALKESYRLYQHYFASQNPRIIGVLEELASCSIKLRDIPEAEKYLTIALDSASAIFTDNHPTLMRLQELKNEVEQLKQA